MSALVNRLRRSVLFVLLVVGLCSAGSAFAYRMIQNTSTGRVTSGNLVTCSNSGGFVHWTGRDISWYHNTSGQGSGKAAALQAALQTWTNVSGSKYALSYAGTTGAGWSTDGQNTMLWATGNGCTGSCLALTALVLQSGQVIVESDVTFNANYTWTTNGSQYDTQSVATHELGHTLGIHHTEVGTTPRPTMYASYFGSGARSLESDDVNAIRCSENRYPCPIAQSCEDDCWGEWASCWDPGRDAYCNALYDACIDQCPCV